MDKRIEFFCRIVPSMQKRFLASNTIKETNNFIAFAFFFKFVIRGNLDLPKHNYIHKMNKKLFLDIKVMKKSNMKT